MRPYLLLSLALLPLVSPAAAKPTAAGAEAFLAGLYKPYARQSAEAVTLKQPVKYFEARLARAIIADAAAAAKLGEVPELNGDPICDCQDYVPFQATIGPVQIKGNRAEATVRFDNTRPQRLQYTLIATKAGWRIYDIRTSDYRLRGLYKL